MKKNLLLIGLLLALTTGSYAQKYAMIDMEYILKKIPAYENMNKELELVSQQWQNEIDSLVKEAGEMYKNYQAAIDILKGDEKIKRENEIVAKEKEIQQLRDKYFGPQGELFKRREAYMKPIQDDIYNAIKDISFSAGYKAVIDRASATSIIFASPDIDISDQVLVKLGY
ncbi:MAG TPA: OmpH family outer membrane protein [Dysgonamonadaceae bacterium]|jgi:outer membrane protein|nr:OmpH family outer membrane protein [Dysgonamonadaceae bacterium]